MKWKKILSLLLVAVLVGSLFAVFGSSPASADQYVDEIRLEVRMEQSVGVGDTATGVLDGFLQAVEGPIYDGIRDEWKAQIMPLESFGSYSEMTFNEAFTEDNGVELDTVGAGDPADFVFNPFALREVRYATNWLISRQDIVEDIHDGFAAPMYQAIGPGNPAYQDELAQIDEKHGMEYAGDFDKGYNMIQDAIGAWEDNPDLTGDLRMGDDFWEYRPEGGDWAPVEIEALIRIEDARHTVGLEFSDLLEEAHIKVDRNVADRALINVWLFTDPADFEWGFYTGGWIASAAVAYQHSTVAQFYTDYWPFMTGGIFGEANRYYHLRDQDYAEEQLERANRLMTGQIPTIEEYWDVKREITDVGVYQSMRIFLENSQEIVPMNRDSVTEIATDAVTGWSQTFSPRTLKTVDGTFTAAQYTAGELYMDNFNNIDGSSDYYGILQQRISKDYGTTVHPNTGLSMAMRANFVADEDTAALFNDRYGEDISAGDNMVRMDYYYEDGVLHGDLPIPDNDDVWFYCVQDEEWLNDGVGYTYEQTDDGADRVERTTAANAVTYNYHLGKWHSGHDLTTRDIIAWMSFAKQLSYGEDWDAVGDQYFHATWGTANRGFYQNLLAIEVVDEDEGILTMYGDYTFPDPINIAAYYGAFPLHPWQMYEAVSHLRGATDLADSGNTPYEVYEWTNLPETNYVHWISSAQAVDFGNTLDNIADAGWIPPYLQGGPTPITESELQSEIDAITDWIDEYELAWISQGPFKITRYDTANLVVEMERFTQAEGYPLANDHWRDILYIGALRHGTLNVPVDIHAGQELFAEIRARVFEEFPDRRTRNLRADDDYECTVTIYDEEGDEVFSSDDVDYRNTDGSYLGVTIPGTETMAWDPGFYTIEFVSSIAGQIRPARTTATVEVMESLTELDDHELSVSPTSGVAPLTVDITATASNPTGAPASDDILVDGEPIGELSVAAGETGTDTIEHIFEQAGTYTVSFGPVSQTVTVSEREPVEGLENYDLSVSPVEGEAPLEVTITASVENVGEEEATDYIYINGVSEFTVTVPAGQTVTEEFTYTFDDAGSQLIEWGDESVVVDVQEEEDDEEETPGFMFLLLGISAVFAVVIYHTKKR